MTDGLGRGCHKGRRRQQRVIRFLQPCILLMLGRGETHGYSLLAELSEYGFDPDQLDPSLVYRALRQMEMDGWVSSRWDEKESQGPRRRVYQILPAGNIYLQEWIADLQRTRAEIDRLLTAYEREYDTMQQKSEVN